MKVALFCDPKLKEIQFTGTIHHEEKDIRISEYVDIDFKMLTESEMSLIKITRMNEEKEKAQEKLNEINERINALIESTPKYWGES